METKNRNANCKIIACCLNSPDLATDTPFRQSVASPGAAKRRRGGCQRKSGAARPDENFEEREIELKLFCRVIDIIAFGYIALERC